MTRLHDPIVHVKPPLTPARTLVVVVIAVAVALAAGIAVTLLAVAFGALVSAASPSTWEGVGTVLIGVGVAVVCAPVLAIVSVAVGLRGRAKAGKFTVLFAATLVAVPLALALLSETRGSTGLPLPANGAQVFLLAGLPLLWAVPAVFLGVVRWRWLAIVVTLGAVLVGAVLALDSLASDRKQAALNEAYEGPIYAPSFSPESPLDGYLLTQAKLPGPYEDWEGAERIGFSYVHLGLPADGLHDDRYWIKISEGDSDLWCDDPLSRCEEVGQALGSTVLFDPQTRVFTVVLDDGVITLDGEVSADQALAILTDLQPSTLENISALELYEE